jgi:hypothetical protein
MDLKTGVFCHQSYDALYFMECYTAATEKEAEAAFLAFHKPKETAC